MTCDQHPDGCPVPFDSPAHPLPPRSSEAARQGVIGIGRVDLLERIGRLWRGDWSGREFDGRDGQFWISLALHGTADDLRKLDAELHSREVL